MFDEAGQADSSSASVPAKSRQKAMEWSLVLASQGIPHLIASPDETGNWSLRIASTDVTRAASAIRQYEIENRSRPWQQHYLDGRIIFDWVAVVWAAALIPIHALSEQHQIIKDAGVMHGADVMRGEWWRLITATQLHADWGHLASNLSIGVVLLGLVMGRWGTGTGMLFALLAGMGGNVANLLIRPEVFSLGASTVVMGCLGLLAILPQSPSETSSRIWRNLFGSLSGAVLLFMLLGLDPRSDVLAHTGGFVAGLGLAIVLRICPALSHKRIANAVAVTMLGALVFVSWWLALRNATPA